MSNTNSVDKTPTPVLALTVDGPAPAISRRKGEIREAALTLMAERGYHGTSMADIARLVDVRASSLYNHITSKQSVLVDIMTTTMYELLAEFDSANGVGRPVDRIRRAMEAHVCYHAVHQREVRIGNREIPSLKEPARGLVIRLRDNYERKWQTLIQTGIDDGEFVTPSAQLAAYALLEMGIGVSQWYRKDGPLSLTEITQHYGEMAVRLLGFEEKRESNVRTVKESVR